MNNINSIEFWEYSGCCDWPLFKSVNKETKCFHQMLLLFYKSLWDFSKKRECENIIQNWKMTFQTLGQKCRQFLELVDDDDNLIEPFYTNGGSWLKLIDHSNFLCARAMRAFINHTPTGEYRLCFFPKEEFKCPYGLYPIESRQYIPYEY